jgi:GT2 family glycosyltransferase
MNRRTQGSILVVTVTYGKRWHLLREALASARRDGVDGAVVVDNGAEDDIKPLVRAEFGAFAEVLTMGKNTGSAGGFKAGIERALARNADYLLLLDDDNQLQAGCLTKLRAALEEASASMPLESLAVLAYRSDHMADIAARLPSIGLRGNRSVFFGFHLLDIPFKIYRRTALGRRWVARRMPLSRVTVSKAPYSGLFFHRRMPETHGLPDERFVLYGDDFEFSYRLTRAGGKIVLVSDARILDMEPPGYPLGRRGSGSTFDAYLLSDDDLRAFYSTRNQAYFERWQHSRTSVMRAINRDIYLAALRVRAAMLRRTERFNLLMRAIRDGEAGRLGEHPEFRL